MILYQPENRKYLTDPKVSESVTAIIGEVLSTTLNVEGKDRIDIAVNMVTNKENFQAVWIFQCKFYLY